MDLLFSSDKEILKGIGEKVRAKRIASQLTQAQAAKNAGVSESSVYNIETGKSISLSTLISILRALHALNLLAALTDEEPVSPLAMAEALRKSQPKKRVRNKNPQPVIRKSEW